MDEFSGEIISAGGRNGIGDSHTKGVEKCSRIQFYSVGKVKKDQLGSADEKRGNDGYRNRIIGDLPLI